MPDMSSCAKCGACSTVCPVYRVSGNEAHIARGKLHLLDVLGLHDSSAGFIDIFSACLLCGACSAVCSRHIDIKNEIVRARTTFSSHAGPHGYEKYLAQKILDSPIRLKGLSVLARAGKKLFASHLPNDSGLRLRLAVFGDQMVSSAVIQDDLSSVPSKKPFVWFPGCAAQYLSPDIASGCKALMADLNFSLTVPDDLSCCGLAAWAAGDLEGARENGRKNIRALEKTDGDILLSCASCFVHLKKYPVLFAGEGQWEKRAQQVAARLQEMSAFIGTCKRKQKEIAVKRLRVFYHDPCHMRFDAPGVDKSREILQETGEIEIVSLPDGPRCCGQGGLFHVAHPDISAHIRDQLVTDVLALQPEVITTTCSGCLMQWQQGLMAAGSDVKVLHLAKLLSQLQEQ